MAFRDREKMETWRQITGYEGVYDVSSKGRVRRVGRRVLKPNTSGRYAAVDLSKDGVTKRHLVHRLVAKAFIPNPRTLPEINHKDCNGYNNNVDNLEWCDRLYNIRYADRTEKAAKACEKAVICIENKQKYDSVTKAAIACGLHKSKISLVCNGKRKTAGGLHWCFA